MVCLDAPFWANTSISLEARNTAECSHLGLSLELALDHRKYLSKVTSPSRDLPTVIDYEGEKEISLCSLRALSQIRK